MEEQRILTHGYVHGHIHKHKDHTHIHGHIHNHDHEDKNKITSLDEDLSEACKEFEELAHCKDILCDELDDCFFFSCEDSKRSECGQVEENPCGDYCATVTDSCAVEPHVHEPTPDYDNTHCSKNGTCTDSTCQGYVETSLDWPTKGDADGICYDPKCVSDLKISYDCCGHEDLQTLSTDHTRNVFESLISNVSNNFLANPESLGVSEPAESDRQYSKDCTGQKRRKLVADPHIHQSCFHTTVPNYSEMNCTDYDFMIQFDTFREQQQQYSPILYSQRNFSCQWDHCFQPVNDSIFMDHLMEQHLQTNVDPKQTSFHCEWSDCNHTVDDYYSMISHVQQHRHETKKAYSPALTPVSNERSSNPSPLSHRVDANDNPVNIKSVKIIPKSKPATKEDPSFTCKWETGTDAEGNPILCNIQHKYAGDLQDHIKNVHIGSGKSVYHCKWVGCERHNGKAFPQRQKLLRHIHVHTNYKPCVCEICGSAFAVERLLEQHLRVHSGEKPYECATCGKRFVTSSSLSIHNRVHTGEKPMVCKWPGCNKSFRESSNLTKHMRIHTKSFTCEVCGEVFEKKMHYSKHIKSHSEHQNHNAQ